TRSGYIVMGGGFAEIATALPGQALKLPDTSGLEEASLMEPLSCCVHSIKKTELGFGDTLVVIGAGTMGAMHVALAKLHGARVMVSDLDDERLKILEKMGADITINPRRDDAEKIVRDHTEGRGADAAIVAAGARIAGEQALKLVRKGGTVVFYSSLYPPAPVDLDWNHLHYNETVIKGTEGSTARDFQEAVGLLAGEAIDLRPLISKVISLEELPGELANKPAGEMQRVIVTP
ncbi:MAG TPA: zinc-binding dehydrogenase, partial [Blastocatellia bacterium]